jgi:hypothetical protein
MKTIAATILIVGYIILLCIFADSISAQQPIAAFSLSELIESNDEVKCYSHYYNTNPEIVQLNLELYQAKYKKELQKKGYKITKDDFNLIHILVPFTKNGHIMSWKQFIKFTNKHIIGDSPEKTTFHYDVLN